jgi:transcriptional regulator with XRE-family HTH domain
MLNRVIRTEPNGKRLRKENATLFTPLQSPQAKNGLFGKVRPMVTEPAGGLPAPPPEAVLLRLVRKASRVTLADAAKAAGISKAWLSSIENGHDMRGAAGVRPVRASDMIVAHLAAYLGISPARLEDEGERPDAAAVLREILASRERHQPPEPGRPRFADPEEDRIAARMWEIGRARYDDEGLREFIKSFITAGRTAPPQDRSRAAG